MDFIIEGGSNQKPQEKKKTNFTEGVYLGKIFKKKGVSAKTGKEWTQYQLQVKVGEKTWNFWAFGSLKGMDTLKEGETFNFGYNEEPIEVKGETYNIKSCFFVGPPKSNQSQAQPNTATNPVQSISGQPSDQESGFIGSYLAQVQPSEWSCSHFIGAYIRNTQKDHPLIKRLEWLYANKVNPKTEVNMKEA